MTRRRLQAAAGLAAFSMVVVAVASVPYATGRVRGNALLHRTLRAKWRGARYVGEPAVRQQTFNDCGAACLKMVLSAHAIDRDLAALKLAVATRDAGTSLRELRLAAEREGLHARSWKLAGADLVRAPLPAIAYVNGDHFVVVRRLVDPATLEVDDPALGRLHWPLRSFRASWSGETLVFDDKWRPGNG